ncbi:MAG: hypothetical protein JJT94_15035 [Bernardetiaceae bacterium]|nr:hypothetical protein [Bernardetiaceae bacterium]
MYRMAYFHGLYSHPNEFRLKTLAAYAKSMYAPQIDYVGDNQVFKTLLKECKAQDINFIVGSSAGGLMGFHLAKHLGCRTLLLNPALPYLSVRQDITGVGKSQNYYNQIIIGAQDTTILPEDTLQYLKENEAAAFYTTEIIETMGHRTSPEVFVYACEKYIKDYQD